MSNWKDGQLVYLFLHVSHVLGCLAGVLLGICHTSTQGENLSFPSSKCAKNLEKSIK